MSLPPPAPVPVLPKPRRWRLLLAAVLIPAALFASVGWYMFGRTDTLTVRGTISLDHGDYTATPAACTGKDGYRDIAAGAAVTVLGPKGEVLGLGAVGHGDEVEVSGTGWTATGICKMPFTVDDVPAGRDFYGVQVGLRPAVRFAEEKLAHPVELGIVG